MGDVDGARVQSGCHQAGDMGDVGEQDSSHLVRHRTEAGEVDRAGIRARPADDQLRPVLLGETLDLSEIDQP
jgi:hypothetical protein